MPRGRPTPRTSTLTPPARRTREAWPRATSRRVCPDCGLRRVPEAPCRACALLAEEETDASECWNYREAHWEEDRHA